MLLTPDQLMIRDAVRDFAQQELWPNAAQWDKEHTFPHEVHKGLAASGPNMRTSWASACCCKASRPMPAL